MKDTIAKATKEYMYSILNYDDNLKEEYIASQVLKYHGWDAFVKRCKQVGIEYFIKIALPCQSPDHQCRMVCKRSDTCQGYSDYIDGNVIDYVIRK